MCFYMHDGTGHGASQIVCMTGMVTVLVSKHAWHMYDVNRAPSFVLKCLTFPWLHKAQGAKWQPLGLNIGVPMLKWVFLCVERRYDEN